MKLRKKPIAQIPRQRVLDEIDARFRLDGKHIRANFNYAHRGPSKKDDIVGQTRPRGRPKVNVKHHSIYLSDIGFYLHHRKWPPAPTRYVNGD